MSKPGFTADCAKRLCNVPINVMPPGGGAGGARDEMGDFDHLCMPHVGNFNKF